MSEHEGQERAATAAVLSTERRHGDRRRNPGAGRRGPRPAWQRWAKIVGRDVVMVVATLSAILLSIHYTKPIYANQPSVIESLASKGLVAKAVVDPVPADTTPLGQLVASPQFERDRKAFAEDLVRTGQVTPARADSIAFYAVREAYVREIPPAVVFGVMLTENARFISHAMSNVGAVGLMQIYPKYWLKPLGKRFGRDLQSDSTNVKYGVYILSEYIKSSGDTLKRAELGKGLLRYNGCVRGTNTPNCKTYPAKVERYVNKSGKSICADRTFTECIAKPFIAGLTGRLDDVAE